MRPIALPRCVNSWKEARTLLPNYAHSGALEEKGKMPRVSVKTFKFVFYRAAVRRRGNSEPSRATNSDVRNQTFAAGTTFENHLNEYGRD